MVIRLFPKHIFRQKVKESFMWSFVGNCKSCLSSATLPLTRADTCLRVADTFLLISNFLKLKLSYKMVMRHWVVAIVDMFLEMSWRTDIGSHCRRNRAFIVVTHNKTLCTISPHNRFHSVKSSLIGGPMRNCLRPNTGTLRTNALSKSLSKYVWH